MDRGSLRLTSLEKRFGHVTAVHDFSLDARPGEFVTVVGPSGSGKTTTLAMIAGFEAPDAGSVVLDGRDITYLPAHRRDVGVVFQNYALFPHMTVAQNVAFPLNMRRMGGDEVRRRVGRALELVRLEGLEGRYPRELSGGQQQRVAVARATVYDPSLLLMDEPLSALDRNLREELRIEIRRLHRDLGTSVLYVTHDQEEALSLSDRIVVMRTGRIEQVGTPQEVYRHPASVFVARFFGESNLLAGTVVGVGGDGSSAVRLGNGLIVTARSGAGLAPGEDVVLLIRPESLHLGTPQEGSPAVPSLAIRVNESVYLGDHVRQRGTFETGEECFLHLRPWEAASLLPDGSGVVWWRPEECTAIPKDR